MESEDKRGGMVSLPNTCQGFGCSISGSFLGAKIASAHMAPWYCSIVPHGFVCVCMESSASGQGQLDIVTRVQTVQAFGARKGNALSFENAFSFPAHPFLVGLGLGAW